MTKLSRLARIESRLTAKEDDHWAYSLEPAYLRMTDDERAELDAISDKINAAYRGNVQEAVKVLSDHELDVFMAFCIAAGVKASEDVS